MQIKLDNRLQAAADLVLPGKPAADIGTDHNYLPVYLVINKICPSVIATEKARIPYKNALQLVDLLSLHKQISVRRGDGLTVLRPGEVASIVIAGMGGYLIADILEKAPQILAMTERLILQPQKNADVLRLWLADHGWTIVRESIALEHGFYYVVIAAEPGVMTLTSEQAVFGPCLLAEPHPLLREYLKLKLTDLLALLEQLELEPGDAVAVRRGQLREQMACIEQILSNLR